LVCRVRELDPADAVIATEVALLDCQLSLTLCPAEIVFVFAENTRLGIPGFLPEVVPVVPVVPVPPPHAERLKSADSSTTKKYTLRRGL